MLLNSKNISSLMTLDENSNLAQVGVDLSVKGIQLIEGGGVILKNKTIINPEFYIDIPVKEQTIMIMDKETGKPTELKFEGWFLHPGEYAVEFNEGITLPTNKTAFVLHRSSVYRQGNLIMSPVWDPGFSTRENTMSTTLIVNNAMYLEKGARVAQVIIHENEEAEAYNGQWQGTNHVGQK